MKGSSHQSDRFVKVLYIGDSSVGKTTSLVSLVKAGYRLLILDLDNGLDSLLAFTRHTCPENIDNIDYITVRDPIVAGTAGPKITAKAYVEATKYLTTWDDGSSPSEAGENTVIVIDSFTTLGKSAFEWARAANPTAKDPRNWFFAAQQSLENIVAMLTAEAFHANVIIISHVNWKENEDGTTKGYPTAIGSALGPVIPRYFNNLLMADKVGSGKNLSRRIRTVSTGQVDLKVAKPFLIEGEYPLGTGMADIFRTLKTPEERTEK